MSNIILPLAFNILATTLVWLKQNSKNVFGLDLSPFIWWLVLGLSLEYLYLNAWWILSEEIGAWRAYIALMLIGTTTSICWMSAYYGFDIKYLMSAALIVCAGILAFS